MNKGMTFVVGLAAIAVAVFAGLDYFNKSGSSGSGSASTGSGGFGGSLGLLGGTNTGIASPVTAGVLPTGGGTVAGATATPGCKNIPAFLGPVFDPIRCK